MIRPDVEAVLAPLKGFQQATVEYAFERLFLAPDSTRRFLVADEVGLGKTLSARGIVARAIDHLWDRVERIDIVYICSNASIARQNVSRLIVGDFEPQPVERLTMLATSVHELQEERVNYIALTPGTSFELKTSLGRREERALLYCLLRRCWKGLGRGAEHLLQGSVSDTAAWKRKLREFERTTEIDRDLAERFEQDLRRADATAPDGSPGRRLKERFQALEEQFRSGAKRVGKEVKRERRLLVGELRGLLAATSVRALEPDLVILDEFQRFRHLLAGEGEAGALARELLEFGDGEEGTRVLLLSATPYKMYTIYGEAEGDDHYRDFLQTASFLAGQKGPHEALEVLLRDFRRALLAGGEGMRERLVSLKGRIEEILRRLMSRVERPASGNGMLREASLARLAVAAHDVCSFARGERVARQVESASVLEYWKSAPYLLNFMDEYKYKRQVERSLESARSGADLAGQFDPGPGYLLAQRDLEEYKAVDPGNARLRALLGDLEEGRAWELLWVPPALPYHELEEPFATAARGGFTKRLVFSRWNVVPKTLSALLSYEAERRAVPAAYQGAQNTPEDRKKRRGLLRFSKSEGRLTGMPVLALLYPGTTLAQLGDPMVFAQREFAAGRKPTLHGLLDWAEERVRGPLEEVREHYPGALDGQPDEAWYWAAPVLLDLRPGRNLSAQAWLEDPELEWRWRGLDLDVPEPDGDGEVHRIWYKHVAQLHELKEKRLKLGRPPADLAWTLALLAVAGPSICALRALGRWAPCAFPPVDLRFQAAGVAWALRSLFNRQEAMAIVRRAVPEEPYWRQVLAYSARGCLQAVLDEYAHQVPDLAGLSDRKEADTTLRVAEVMSEALGIRTSTVTVDCFLPSEGRVPVRHRGVPLRVHFARRFGQQRTEDEKDVESAEAVRKSFNSPFWPFVLATTSLGQEGLDFHPYCHSVVHWNLPSNPVDLEQREGRVNRYKGHAIRKNLARHFGEAALMTRPPDIWAELFHRASAEGVGDAGGLWPFWVFPLEGGACVERCVPALPLSRDAARYAALRRSLAVYRMVFGQPQQEDLVSYLLEHFPSEQIEELRELVRIDLSPPGCRQRGTAVGTESESLGDFGGRANRSVL